MRKLDKIIIIKVNDNKVKETWEYCISINYQLMQVYSECNEQQKYLEVSDH